MLQFFDDLPSDPGDAFIYVEKHFRNQFLAEPISEEGMINYVRAILWAKWELKEIMGFSVPLNCDLHPEADLNREMLKRFKRPFDRKMFDSFRSGVKSVVLILEDEKRPRVPTRGW